MALSKANSFGNGQNYYAGECTLYQLRGFVGRGPCFIHVLDSAESPYDDASPDLVVPTEGGEFVLDFGANGRPMADGITVALSTTLETTTLFEDSGAVCPSFFDVIYEPA